MSVHVKVCCIQDAGEARLAARHGASAVGLVGPMPSGPGTLSLEQVAEIAAELRADPDPTVRGLDTFLLTSATEVQQIADQARRTGASTVQIVDDLAAGAHAELRSELPGARLIQVLHLGGAVDLGRLRAQVEGLAPHLDGFLLDSGSQAVPVKVLGGTGRTHDWEASRAVVQASSLPVWLAGGLRPENVAAAVAAVRPHGVDVCSRLRDAAGRLVEARLAAFVAAARAAT